MQKCKNNCTFAYSIIHNTFQLYFSGMKYTKELDELIFYKWDVERLTFCEIAQTKLPAFLSLKCVRNIIYLKANRNRISRYNANYEEFISELYKLFRLKMMEFQDVNAAIRFVYENQPRRRYSQDAIRRAINRVLTNRKTV